MPSSASTEPTLLQLAEALVRGNILSDKQRYSILQHIRETQMPAASTLRLGDEIAKPFPGAIRGWAVTEAGLLRFVVEPDHPDFRGMLHIFAPENLRRRK